MKVLIAGASGFIGTKLSQLLLEDSRIEKVVGFSRSDRKPLGKMEWLRCDLADLDRLQDLTPTVDYALYLVHSMSPQARLSQGTFEDFDLQQADNFARACAARSIGKIIYLGGILPSQAVPQVLSAHLRSRAEVERVLTSRGAQVTVLRAGLILGKGGSSTEMLLRLVRRLPVMFVPKWTLTRSEPVDVDAVVRSIHGILFEPSLQGESWDLAGPELLTYRELMLKAAKVLGLRRRIIPLPPIPPEVSRLWVSLISGAPRSLVYPLVKSLKHEMTARPNRNLLDRLGIKSLPVEEAIKNAISVKSGTQHEPSAFHHTKPPRGPATVRSIQRIAPLDAAQLHASTSLAERYFNWLPKFLFGVLNVHKKATETTARISFRIRGTRISLLELESMSSNDRDLERFQIVGGWLHTPKSGGFLEFRVIPEENCGLSIVQDFVPRLPWAIYVWTQALIHLWVMRRFQRSIHKHQ